MNLLCYVALILSGLRLSQIRNTGILASKHAGPLSPSAALQCCRLRSLLSTQQVSEV